MTKETMTIRDYIKVGNIGDRVKYNLVEFYVVNLLFNGIVVQECYPQNSGILSNYSICWNNLDGLIEVVTKITSKNNMNIKEKFVLAITPEPKKSFRKVGITDGDDILTDEGTRIFLTWLLHNKYAEEFKKDVVDGILEEEGDKKEEIK